MTYGPEICWNKNNPISTKHGRWTSGRRNWINNCCILLSVLLLFAWFSIILLWIASNSYWRRCFKTENLYHVFRFDGIMWNCDTNKCYKFNMRHMNSSFMFMKLPTKMLLVANWNRVNNQFRPKRVWNIWILYINGFSVQKCYCNKSHNDILFMCW